MPIFSRLGLYARVYLWRFLVRLNSILDRRLSSNKPQRESFVVNAKLPGRDVGLLVYTPTNYKSAGSTFPLVVNFHGGGFMMGTAYEDARWFQVLCDKGVVVISIDYRLAPEHPHPAGVQDCIEAVQWIWEQSSLKIDRQRTVLTGFSAGGTMALIAGMRLSGLCGILAVYPGIDRSLSRETRAASNPKSVQNAALNLLFDEAYGCDNLDLTESDISPGKASDKELMKLPNNIALYSAELDPLLTETEDFRQRLLSLSKNVLGEVVVGKAHYWDKKPLYRQPDIFRTACYNRMCADVLRMLEVH